MLTNVLFPGIGTLRVTAVEAVEQKVKIHVVATTETATCPSCQTSSSRIHSHYYRFPHDLPCVGQKMRLKIRVRRFFCDNSGCPKRTFAEQFPLLLAVRARQTQRLTSRLRWVAYEVSAESGQRLLEWLDIECTADRLLRLIRADNELTVKTPRVLGVDDWAKRKGHCAGYLSHPAKAAIIFRESHFLSIRLGRSSIWSRTGNECLGGITEEAARASG